MSDTDPPSANYAWCVNVNCTEHHVPKGIFDFPVADVQCGGCGGPLEPSDPPTPEVEGTDDTVA